MHFVVWLLLCRSAVNTTGHILCLTSKKRAVQWSMSVASFLGFSKPSQSQVFDMLFLATFVVQTPNHPCVQTPNHPCVQSFPAQPISLWKAKKKEAHMHTVNFSKNVSAKFDNHTNLSHVLAAWSAFLAQFTWSRCTMCTKDHGLFYLNYPEINEDQKSDGTDDKCVYFFLMGFCWFRQWKLWNASPGKN